MKLKEKLAENYLDEYGESPENPLEIERAYLAGFKKAREMASKYVKKVVGHGVDREIDRIGEEEAKTEIEPAQPLVST